MNVLHKDMCYHCPDELKADPEFLLEQQNVFIIREPGRSIVSHFAMFAQMPVQAIGHKALYDIFCLVTKLTGKIPYVVNGDDLANRPEETLRRLCDHLQLEFLPEALSWTPSCPPQWNAWRSWHREAERSSGIVSSQAPFDEQQLTTHPHLMEYYHYHRPFYERMNQFKQQAYP